MSSSPCLSFVMHVSVFIFRFCKDMKTHLFLSFSFTPTFRCPSCRQRRRDPYFGRQNGGARRLHRALQYRVCFFAGLRDTGMYGVVGRRWIRERGGLTSSRHRLLLVWKSRVLRASNLFTQLHPHTHNPQKGLIHCWDLRTDKEVWVLTAPRELGYLTALTLGKESFFIYFFYFSFLK